MLVVLWKYPVAGECDVVTKLLRHSAVYRVFLKMLTYLISPYLMSALGLFGKQNYRHSIYQVKEKFKQMCLTAWASLFIAFVFFLLL